MTTERQTDVPCRSLWLFGALTGTFLPTSVRAVHARLPFPLRFLFNAPDVQRAYLALSN